MFGGWIAVLQTIHSGAPFTVVSAANTTNAFPAGPLRPDLIGDPELPADEQRVDRWFDTTAFAPAAPFAFGNSPRSVLRGPGLNSTDVMLEKRIALTDRFRLDLRAEAFNALNRTNFNLPGATLGAAGFGVISSARPARTMQLSVRLGF